MRIAIIDSDPHDRLFAAETAAAAHHAVTEFDSVEALLAHPVHTPFDLLVVAWRDAAAMPHLLGTLRAQYAAATLLCLLPPAGADEMREALAAGVHDCQFKPLRRGELRARIAALQQHYHPQAATAMDIATFGAYRFEVQSGRVYRQGEALEVTRKEFDLALLLFRNLGRPLSRAYMQEAVWGIHADLPSRTIDTHVSRVRSKLGLRPENGFRLVPVYSYGYRLETVTH